MVEVTIKISSCLQCPFCSCSRTADAGYAYDYWCDKFTPKRIIAYYVEYAGDFPKEIPAWCPFRKENKNE